jgi:polysaccharide deacetylase family protein (PEP-CTERM system associated)
MANSGSEEKLTIMKNGLSFDVEDWFQVENLRSAVRRDQWETMPLRVETNTRKILDLLRPSGTKATFFFLGWVAERCPQLVKDVDREGHEVASHGYGHDLVYNLTAESFREDIRRSKKMLEDMTGKPVWGYRAPSFSIVRETMWAIDVLKEEGFSYDSSIFPVSFHDRYGFAECGALPFRWPNGLLEIPLAVYQMRQLGLPVAGGGYFRLFPYAYFKFLLRRLNIRQQPFTFYLHPWELDPSQPRVSVPLFLRFRHYVNLSRTEKRLSRLLTDFPFERMAVVYDVNKSVSV